MKISMSSVRGIGLLLAAIGSAFAASARAESTAADGAHTCIGAEAAANADGSIPAFSGRWLGGAPGAISGAYDPGPYADEKPLFTISAANMAQHAAHLSEGQKALLKRYPNFRMPVYPSHRDYRYPDWVCAAVRDNAQNAKLVHDGLGFTGVTGGIPFPAPKDGLEAQWNMQNPHRAWTETAVLDQFVVYPDGKTAQGRVRYKILSPWNNPTQRGSNQDRVNSYFYSQTLLPERERGTLIVGWTPNDTSIDRQAWTYSPGTRRVRQTPEFGFDTPQGAGGFRTVDDDRLFNGSPERYDWTLIGKKEIYVPYHVFAINDPKIKYSTLMTPGSINPDYMRYELHRVWVVEAKVKSGYRHSYARRTFYVDEDTWHALWADNYDSRGELWRASLVTYFPSPDIEGFHAGVSVFHDLTANAYYVDRLVNESPQWWTLNKGDVSPEDFSPGAAQRGGR